MSPPIPPPFSPSRSRSDERGKTRDRIWARGSSAAARPNSSWSDRTPPCPSCLCRNPQKPHSTGWFGGRFLLRLLQIKSKPQLRYAVAQGWSAWQGRRCLGALIVGFRRGPSPWKRWSGVTRGRGARSQTPSEDPLHSESRLPRLPLSAFAWRQLSEVGVAHFGNLEERAERGGVDLDNGVLSCHWKP
jgi:hypothetical protein